MQVDPIKPTLKAPGIKLVKLKHDKPLSNIAFNWVQLRPYDKDACRRAKAEAAMKRMMFKELNASLQ